MGAARERDGLGQCRPPRRRSRAGGRAHLVALDITERVVQEAIDCGAQLIVSHHPVMNVRWHEREMQTLRPDTRLGGVLTTLVKTTFPPSACTRIWTLRTAA